MATTVTQTVNLDAALERQNLSRVEDLARDVAYRINDVNFTDPGNLENNFIPLVNEMVKHLDMVVYWERVNLHRKTFALQFQTGQENQDLPLDFIGLSEFPWVDGQIKTMNPLEDRRTALTHANNPGTPLWYELEDSKIWVYPLPSVPVVIRGFYFHFSPRLHKARDSMPYNGIFDQIIKEYLVKIYHTSNTVRDEIGKFMIAVDPKMTQEFQQAVKHILVRRTGHTNRRVKMRRWV